MQRQSINIEELPLEYHTREDGWLSRKFNSIPFLLYKLWMILNFAIALMYEIIAISQWDKVYGRKLNGKNLILYTCFNLTLVLVVYGFGEMLFAIFRRKSSAAQRSFLKFQYYLVGLLICLVGEGEDIMKSLIHGEIYFYLYVALSPFVNLVGGYAALKAFKKNHPLQRQVDSQASEASNPLAADFLEQNQAITSELSKYDQKLDRWPYVVYNWWLKFAVFYEISIIFSCLLFLTILYSFRLVFSTEALPFIGGLILSLFTAFSRFEIEVAMRTRMLVRSKRALLLLKISIVSSILTYFLIAKTVDANIYESLEILIPSFERFGFFAAIPVICLLGAIKVHKLIEEREAFAKVSSFVEESYL